MRRRPTYNRGWLPYEEDELIMLMSVMNHLPGGQRDFFKQMIINLNRPSKEIYDKYSSKRYPCFDTMYKYIRNRLNRRKILVYYKLRHLQSICLKRQNEQMEKFKEEYSSKINITYDLCPVCCKNQKETTDSNCAECEAYFNKFFNPDFGLKNIMEKCIE